MTPPFVEIATLAAWQAAARPVQLVDARSARAFAVGHIPGAATLEWGGLNPLAGGALRLIAPADLAQRLHAAGIGPDPAVVYGSRGGSDAALVWWTLLAGGHPEPLLLDGGFEAWTAAGGPVSQEAEPSAGVAPTKLQPRHETLIEMEELVLRLGDPLMHVLDTRAPPEYSGEERLAARGGHIPGAHLVPWSDTLAESPPLLRAEPELRALYRTTLAAPEVISYCQSGARAAHTFAVLKMLGHPRPRLYLASWQEWGNALDTPVE